MCYLMVYVIFDFQSEATLKDSALMGKALTALDERGFHPSEEGFESAAAVWNAALRRGQRSVWAALENRSGFGFSVSVVTSNWRRLYISADRSATGRPGGAQTLIKACETLYNALHPDYGYGLISLDTQPLDPPDEGDFDITSLYDYNFFSPRLVEKLKREQINAVTANRTVKFDDGGLLLEMSPDPLGNKQAYRDHYATGAKILGAKQFQQGA